MRKESQIFILKSIGISKLTYAFLVHSRRNQNILLLPLGLFSCYFSNYICLFLAVVGLRCCPEAFSSFGEWGLPFVVVCGLLTAMASLVAEHGL